MRYVEYGKENRETVVLLHGGGLSWWNYKEAAQRLQSHYRVILPVLNGHAQSTRSFTTIEENAAQIIAFIDEHFGGSVLLIGGLSLGGQIALEILAQRKDVCRYAFIESAPVIPSMLTHSLIRPLYGSCYGLVRKKWFSKLQFRSLGIREELFEDYYRDTCAITKENMIAFLEANARYSLKDSVAESAAEVHVFVGEKEIRSVRNSAEMICKKIAGCKAHILAGMRHGEFSVNCGNDYAAAVRKAVKEEEVPATKGTENGKA